jgi:transcriptional regulator GlxA family with amidase domain
MNAFARKRVGILVFPDVEVLDFTGPFEVLTLVRLNEERRWDEHSPYDVILIAESMAEIKASGGMRVAPDYTTDDCPKLDVLVIPGGWGTRREINNQRLIKWIAKQGSDVETLTSVCTGSLLLGQARLLDGKPATTHFKALQWFRDSFPSVEVQAEENVVETDNGRVLTSAGISAGIDMALMVVAKHYGENIARATAKFMEYRYPEDNRRHVETGRRELESMREQPLLDLQPVESIVSSD